MQCTNPGPQYGARNNIYIYIPPYNEYAYSQAPSSKAGNKGFWQRAPPDLKNEPRSFQNVEKKLACIPQPRIGLMAKKAQAFRCLLVYLVLAPA